MTAREGFPGTEQQTQNFLLHPQRHSPIVSPRHGGVAQLGERLTGSQEVRGSIPLVSTIVNARPLERVAFLIFELPNKLHAKKLCNNLLII